MFLFWELGTVVSDFIYTHRHTDTQTHRHTDPLMPFVNAIH
jgi:hypothetical protein